jgi:protein NUD1
MHWLTVLDNNQLASFPPEDESPSVFPSLRSLNLRSNSLQQLDIGVLFPNLQELIADDNRLHQVHGLENCPSLELLSMRDQKMDPDTAHQDPQTIWPLSQQHDLRKLLLSANSIPTFQACHDFLSLEKLELASCGLETLPDRFGVLAPNIRVLNLNFNAITDIKQLIHIKKLKELYLAGNRLSRLRRTTKALNRLGTLLKLDLRDNPLTVGFYLPPVENRLMVANANDSLEDLDEQPYILPPPNEEKDKQYVARLDELTRLRRKVYEVLIVSGCRSLQALDGRECDRNAVLAKDDVWERLVSLGIVTNPAEKQRALCNGKSLVHAQLEEES